MHGNKTTPEIPIFGNKCIANHMGTLDLHGVARTPTWTVLAQTAEAGDTVIVLNEAVDWKAGESIVIAPTGFTNLETEERVIASVDNSDPSKPKITLT